MNKQSSSDHVPGSLDAALAWPTDPVATAVNSCQPRLSRRVTSYTSTPPSSVNYLHPASLRSPTTHCSSYTFADAREIDRHQPWYASQCSPGLTAHACSGYWPETGPESPMAEALLGALEGVEQSKQPPCRSPEELKARLGDTLESKTSPTRSEHISVNLELAAFSELQLVLPESEWDALQGQVHVDPSLGGARTGAVDGLVTRVIRVGDTLANQPQDEPVLQRTASKIIVAAVGEADGSTWVERKASRGNHGWTFTYHCKDSLQEWVRLNAKNSERAVVGEFSTKIEDKINHGRRWVLVFS